MRITRALALATALDVLGTPLIAHAAPCRSASGSHPHGRIVALPAVTGVVTGSVAVPAYRCTNGVWVCAKRCGAEAGAAYSFRDGRLLRLRTNTR
jgi:hypothetical protein